MTRLRKTGVLHDRDAAAEYHQVLRYHVLKQHHSVTLAHAVRRCEASKFSGCGDGSRRHRDADRVEKYLRRTETKTRHDLGREEFLRVLEWQDKHGYRPTQTVGLFMRLVAPARTR
jgi:hypothetical protein